MKKGMVSLMLIGVLLVGTCMIANAAEMRASFLSTDLNYSGTTANCSAVLTSPGDDLELIVELWRGNVRLSRWAEEGSNRIQIDEYRQVLSGSTYVMTVNGSINGEPFDEVSITKTCP